MGERNPTSPPPASARDYRRVVNSWAMYDWANSAFAVIILTAVYPVYYRALVTNAGRSPEDATAYWAYTNSASLLLIALVGPVLGAAADLAGGKMRMLKIALALGVLGSASLAFLGSETFVIGSLLFALANLGFTGGNIFYEALLPHIARPGDLDRVSARGYALGYLGGGLLLVINVLWLYRPQWFGLPDREIALRACFISTALWWFIFALPLFRNIAEPGGREMHSAFRARSDRRLAPAQAHAQANSSLPAGGAFSRRVLALQRRCQHHHQDGGGVWRRNRHRSQ